MIQRKQLAPGRAEDRAASEPTGDSKGASTNPDTCGLRAAKDPLTVGVVALGLKTYWDQFAGLRERLLAQSAWVQRRIAAPSRVVVDLGLLDSAEKGLVVGRSCRENDVDILLVYVTTYALSGNLLPALRRAKVPAIFLNLQPDASIAYNECNQLPSRAAMTARWLAYCSSCPLPEIANAMRRLGLPFRQITGTLRDDDSCWGELEEWLLAATAMKELEQSRMGLMGHYYSGMMDVSTDLMKVAGVFGLQLEMLEVDELSALRRDIEAKELDAKVVNFQSFFEISEDCPNAELRRAASTAVALERLVHRRALDVLAYYYKGTGVSENEDTMSSAILGMSLLTANGIPAAGEYEVKNAIAMKIFDLLAAGGSFTEYYALDFVQDLVLMGHDGPGHVGIAEGKTKVRPLSVYHGKVGAGLSVEMSVRHGAVTLLSVIEDQQTGFAFLIAEGESVPGPVLQLGNTNSFYRFPCGAKRFTETWNACGPAHHCAVGTGHLAHTLSKLADLLGIRCVVICQSEKAVMKPSMPTLEETR